MRIDIRISVEQKENWQSIAKSRGITLTKFIVDTVEGSIGTVHTSKDSGVIEGEDDVHTDSGNGVDSETVHTGTVYTGKDKGVVGYTSGKSEAPVASERVKKNLSGKKGLPVQEVGEFKTYFKK